MPCQHSGLQQGNRVDASLPLLICDTPEEKPARYSSAAAWSTGAHLMNSGVELLNGNTSAGSVSRLYNRGDSVQFWSPA